MTRSDLTPAQVVVVIEDFLSGSAGEWDWDEFISTPLRCPQLDRVRMFCVEVPDRHPPDTPGRYCNEEGLRALHRTALALRSGVDADGKALRG